MLQAASNLVEQRLSELPWYNVKMVEFLQMQNLNGLKVLEYGAGSSTLFYAKRGCSVFCIEKDENWYKLIKAELGALDVRILLCQDLQEYPVAPRSFAEEFDLIVIDSCCRFACAEESIKIIKDKGAIILDNSERENYRKIFEFFANNGFLQKTFTGHKVGKDTKESSSTLFYKTNSIFQ